MTRLAFSIDGEPRAKGRPRAGARIVWNNGEPEAVVSLHTPSETRAAEAVVADLFRAKFPRHVQFSGAVLLRFTAVFPIPSSWPKKLQEAARRGELYHTSKPDKDNVEKLLVDGLNGLAWADDAQVQGGGVKRYGHPARIDVVLELVQQPDLPMTPAAKRAAAKVADHHANPLTRGQRIAPKPKTKTPRNAQPSKLQEAIDAALARDGKRGAPRLL